MIMFILFIIGLIIFVIAVACICVFADEYWYICCAGVWIVFLWVAWMFHLNG